ncbi:MAG TPA: FGGY family carbohydrate kinase [Terracidiphilus sp.]|nr:FGGY family carbohydrate kinase [Terracidiphilus sp.]
MRGERPIVVGLDSSTTASKAIAWTLDGAVAGQGRSAIPLLSPAHNHYEQNAEDWWRSACEALRQLCSQVNADDVAAVAISNQRETFVPLAADGEPVRPAIVWLDQRCEEEVEWLTARVGAKRMHRITGKPPDLAPVAYRIAWMLRHEKERFCRTAMFADVHAYLAWRLTGQFRTSWASADPLGLFDMKGREWSPDVLKALDLEPVQLPEAVRPGTIIGVVSEAAAKATGLNSNTLVVAGGGDGQAAGLGVNALGGGRAYLNLGTALVGGIYSQKYRIGNAWRTMRSCTGEGYYFETSLRAGTFLIDWFTRNVCQATGDCTELLRELESEAAAIPTGSDGLLALPYWGAVMTPYWDAKARGCWVGLSGSHRRGHLYRSLLEGIALEQALVTGMIEEETGATVKEFVAIGGGATSDLWRRIMADATGKCIKRSGTLEASSLGAGICAAVGAGLFRNFEEAAKAMSGKDFQETEPCSENCSRYTELMGAYRELYGSLRKTFAKLGQFQGGEAKERTEKPTDAPTRTPRVRRRRSQHRTHKIE